MLAAIAQAPVLLTFQTLPALWEGREETQRPSEWLSPPRGAACTPCPPGQPQGSPSVSLVCSCWLAISEDWLSTASDIRAELRALPAIKLIPGRLSSCTCGDSRTRSRAAQEGTLLFPTRPGAAANLQRGFGRTRTAPGTAWGQPVPSTEWTEESKAL